MNDKISNVIGCMCEIKTMDNELLAVGKISAYKKEDKSLEIVPCEGDEMPTAQYSTKVKINVFSSNHGFLGLDGFVYIAHSSFWRLYDVYCFGENERRSYFRIKNRSKAEVEEVVEKPKTEDSERFFEEAKVKRYPCIVTSISISGLLIAVDDDSCFFQIGTKLLIKNLAIGESGNLFSLKCCVRRTDYHERLGKLFGCEFVDLNDKEIEKLCQAVFAQQRIEIQRRRGLH